MTSDRPPLLNSKRYDQASQFQVENLLREARRQRGLPDVPVPEVCLLDPDGDVVRHLSGTGHGTLDPAWACYHPELWVTERTYGLLGIVPCAVGAPYAVLVAEELLYAYSAARQRAVVCVAHVTNTMATHGDDFEKGDDNCTHRILAVVDAIAHRWNDPV